MTPTEDELRRDHAEGDKTTVVTHLLHTEGAAILGFLHSRLGSADAAQEVFARFCEDLWRGIESFEWRCSLRGWAYTLARHAEARYRRDRGRAHRRQLRLDDAPAGVLAAVDHVRTTTRLHLRSEVKDRMRALRERLPEEDQTVLVLRVDKGLSWNDLATVMQGQEVDETTLAREAARLRKRFQLIKSRLRDWAREDGLLPPE
ncbi:MAG: sigma-70 family RNA polymerase sigma factor [Deltaproteobacteria bacterium]|nr:sigma-70 family RNA polymerase sigma factor [Deltaproteobacteria bacterium]